MTRAAPKPSVLGVLARYRWALVPLLSLAAVEALFDGGLTIGYKILIDDAIVPHDGKVLALVLAFLAAGLLLAAGLSLWRDSLFARTTASILGHLRRVLFAHSQRLSAAYHDAHPSSELLARFSTDFAGLETWLISAGNTLLLPVMNVAVGIGLLFYFLPWQLALAGVLVWPVVLAGPRLLAPRAARALMEKKSHETAFLATVAESVAAHRVIQAYSLRDFHQRILERSLAPLSGSVERMGFLASLVERSTVLTIYAVQLAALATGAILAYHGAVSVGTFIAFLTVFWNLGWSIVVLARSTPGILSADGSARRIDEILREEADRTDRAGGAPLPPLQSSLTLENVGFGYPERPAVLAGVSLRIRQGEFVAIVGASGSGKSTLLNLLAAFYEPGSGRILVDGVDLRDADIESWRRQMGVVLQENVLFDQSILENIRLGQPEASREEVETAARAAEIHATIAALPQGYETTVGERGGLLSGGQRQRIALARALIRHPAVLLLDEATAALDPQSEAAINETLARVGRGRTTISVTHRLASVMRADRIFVMQDGTIAEEGTHDDLLLRNGIYAGLWRKQSGLTVSNDGLTAQLGIDRLREIALLREVPDAHLAGLAGKFVCLHVPSGTEILREGERSDLFYIIARGSVGITRHGTKGEIARLGPGDEFGELALLNDAPRNATVTARRDCLLLTLPKESFLKLLESSEDLRRKIEEIAAKRVR